MKKILRRALPVLFGCVLLTPSMAQRAADSTVYARPKPFAFITDVPKDVWGVTKSPFQKNGWKGFLAVTASSAILIHYDQQL
ncbi:MAG: hypothetical protein JST39_20280, partial [Bacteroidetes bacterium]|nr:hypothetical protein [Bacteroidota bacterium]